MPQEEIGWLKEAGFIALGVPEALGGPGATLVQQFDLLIDLTEADTNAAQALCSYLALVEDRLVAHKAQAEVQLRRFGKGNIAGNGWTKFGGVKAGDTITKVTPEGNGFRADSDKYYSTDTIFVSGATTLLVNNAANDQRDDTAAVTPRLWRDGMAVNLEHVFFASQAVHASMVAAGSGAIVNFGSLGWQTGALRMVAYGSTKAAILGLTKGLARELGPDNIRVN